MHAYGFMDLEHDIFYSKIVIKKISNETHTRADHKALGGRLAILREKLNSRTFQGEYFGR